MLLKISKIVSKSWNIENWGSPVSRLQQIRIFYRCNANVLCNVKKTALCSNGRQTEFNSWKIWVKTDNIVNVYVIYFDVYSLWINIIYLYQLIDCVDLIWKEINYILDSCNCQKYMPWFIEEMLAHDSSQSVIF